LLRRVGISLDMARQALLAVGRATSAQNEGAKSNRRAYDLIPEKVIAETAMLVYCVYPLCKFDERIRRQAQEIVASLLPHVRNREVWTAVWVDPGKARDHAFAHCVLSSLGFRDDSFDELLAQSVTIGDRLGPERLPHRRLEQEWLARVWPLGAPTHSKKLRSLADSALGRSIDALGANRFDIYAFTHSVMYASDLGGRRPSLSRPLSAVASDATAALAFSLDNDDFDLSAEILLTWPMLRMAWSHGALFAFQLLAQVQDELGFLPGLGFKPDIHRRLGEQERIQYVVATCYHATYIMGFLCAATLMHGVRADSATVAAGPMRGAAAALESLFGDNSPARAWSPHYSALPPSQKDRLAPLTLAIILRRAKASGELRVLRRALEISLECDLTEDSAPQQAAALLRRAGSLILPD
jgi:hypothetical protein